MLQLPDDKITTYGDLAVMAGRPGSARLVGGIAHYGLEDLPWHRLVNFRGGLAAGYPGGRDAQRQLLAQDGIECSEGYYVMDFEARRWQGV